MVGTDRDDLVLCDPRGEDTRVLAQVCWGRRSRCRPPALRVVQHLSRQGACRERFPGRKDAKIRKMRVGGNWQGSNFVWSGVEWRL